MRNESVSIKLIDLKEVNVFWVLVIEGSGNIKNKYGFFLYFGGKK